jgi:hypothetical protein
MPNKFSLRNSPVPFKDMDDRQRAEWLRNQANQMIVNGQTGYDTGTGFFLGDDTDGVTKFSIGNSAGSKLTWNGTALTVKGAVTATSGTFTGGVTIGTSGSLSSGQSAYDTGTGYWLEYNGGTPRFSLGNSSGNKLTWNGSALSIAGSISLTNSVNTFTPTWDGFSADPGGTLSYLNLGALVVLYCTSEIVGSSNAANMAITNVPAGALPASYANGACIVVDNGIARNGAWERTGASRINFGIDLISGSYSTPNTAFFTSGGAVKGIPAGFCIIYPT